MKKGQQKTLIIIGILAIISFIALIVVLFSQSFSPTGQVISEGSSDKNCREVETPYEEQEEYIKTEYYTETVPYEEQIPLVYDDSYLYKYGCSEITNYKECYEVAVMNIDTVGGIFNINCNFRALKRTLTDSDTSYVKPGETVNFKCIADVDLGEDIEFTYTITPPTKPVTRYKDVQRERQVTAYRPVTKYKTEIICD